MYATRLPGNCNFLKKWAILYRVAQKVVHFSTRHRPIFGTVQNKIKRFQRYGVLENLQLFGPPCTHAVYTAVRLGKE